MAGRGPAPKEPSKRLRRNAEPEGAELEARAVKPPTLGRGFSRQTRAWWKTWVESPQAKLFLATDWQRLRMTAALVEAFWAAGEPKLAKELLGEIRLNEAKLGATPEDRLRLRWRLSSAISADERGEPEAPATSHRGDPRLQLVKGRSA